MGPRGTAECPVDPLMCQHPVSQMKARGNKQSKWWTCMGCQSRWKRLDLDSAEPTGGPTADEVVTFGKYQGATFATVAQDTMYCHWVRMTLENGDEAAPGMERLAIYLTELEKVNMPTIKRGPESVVSISSDSDGLDQDM